MVVPEDKLGFSYNYDIKKRIGNETIYFSDKIIHKTLGLFGGNLQRSILNIHNLSRRACLWNRNKKKNSNKSSKGGNCI